MLRERDGPPSAMLLALAGLAMGYAFSSEYPTFFAAIVLGLFLLSRRDSLTPLGVLRRGGAYVAGGLVGIIPLLLYNHYAFRSWTHLAYSDVPRQQKGFFGIGAPSLKVLATLLFDSRGLLTLSPMLIMGAIGTVMLYKRGRRAEALTISGICLCFLLYNSGYYLPFGGGFMGPRFLDTLLPFLAFPVALDAQALPRTDDRARGGLDHDDGDRHHHAPVDRLRERGRHVDALPLQGLLPADDRLRLRARSQLGRDLAVLPGRRRGGRARRVGDAAPAAFGRDARLGSFGARRWGCSQRSHRPRSESTTRAWRASTAPATTPPSTCRCTPAPDTRWTTLAALAVLVGVLALGVMRLTRNQPQEPSRRREGGAGAASPTQPALSG